MQNSMIGCLARLLSNLTKNLPWRLACFAIFLAQAISAAYAMAVPRGTSSGFLQGYTEVALAPASANRKWQKVMKREARSLEKYTREIPGDKYDPATTWLHLIAGLRRETPMRQVQAVNTFFNRYRYESDQKLWGVKDYWETPMELIVRGAGDCEDYAIAKYFALRALDFKADALRIAIVSIPRKTHASHAILLVNLHGEVLVADNLMKSLGHAWDLAHYQPIYSLNEKTVWLYRLGSFPLSASGE